MAQINSKRESIIKLCILSHPDELAINLIGSLIKNKSYQITFNNFDSLGVTISTIKIPHEKTSIKVVLIRTDEKEFFNKLRSYLAKVSGAIILFDRNDVLSFEKAKLFYQSVNKVIKELIVPIVFVDIVEKSEIVSFEGPEESDNPNDNVLYFEINQDDSNGFIKILDYISKKYIEEVLNKGMSDI